MQFYGLLTRRIRKNAMKVVWRVRSALVTKGLVLFNPVEDVAAKA
jgi:hypothetical protein